MADSAPPRAPRADARRNVAAILAAAQDCFATDPHATMSRIAEAAGVGRVTLHGHFNTRADLVDAVFGAVTAEATDLLQGVDTRGEPVAALAALIRASWRVVHRFRAVLAAAEAELPPEKIRGHHDEHLTRVTELIRRGQRSGAFRDDLPASWLTTVVYSLMHAAANDVSAGELSVEDAERAVVSTVLAALTPSGAVVPGEPRTGS